MLGVSLSLPKAVLIIFFARLFEVAITYFYSVLKKVPLLVFEFL